MIKINGVRTAATTEAAAVQVRLSVAAIRTAFAASTAADAAICGSSFQGRKKLPPAGSLLLRRINLFSLLISEAFPCPQQMLQTLTDIAPDTVLIHAHPPDILFWCSQLYSIKVIFQPVSMMFIFD